MKDRAERMQRIARLSESAEQTARRALGQLAGSCEHERGRLEELRRYRREYLDRSHAARRFGSAEWQDYQSFLARLDQAIDIQAGVLADCERRLEAHRRLWVSCRRERDSLERVVERLHLQAAREEARREQVAQDEAAAGIVLHRR